MLECDSFFGVKAEYGKWERVVTEDFAESWYSGKDLKMRGNQAFHGEEYSSCKEG